MRNPYVTIIISLLIVVAGVTALVTGMESEDFLGKATQTSYEWQYITSSAPSDRSGAMMAYIGDGKLLLFGGYDGSTYSDETWVFDYSTQSWSKRYPSNSPPPMAYGSMAYDGSGNAIMFGGENQTLDFMAETWKYSVSSNDWSRITLSAFNPDPRKDCDMEHIADGKVLLFGGLGESDNRYDDTWIFDSMSGQWVEKNPGHDPPARSSHSLSYSEENVVYLFGGYTGSESMDDMWKYNRSLNDWDEVNPIPADPWPGERRTCGFARLKPGMLLLFGGYNGSYNQETWSFDPSSGRWKHHPPESPPEERRVYCFESLPEEESVVLFGGYNYYQGDHLGDTWAYAPKPPEGPILEFLGESGYYYDGVEPEFSQPGGEFNFRIRYRHTNGLGPMAGSPKLHVLDGFGEIADSPFEMTEEDPGNTDYVAGKIYSVEVVLTESSGDYRYFFEGYDSDGIGADGEGTHTEYGPIVNTPPFMSDGIVTPEEGNETTLFRYETMYFDDDNDPPDYVIVTIDGEISEMDKVYPNDNNFKDGVEYYMETGLDPGPHEYYFSTTDWNNYTFLPDKGVFQGPIVSTIPFLEEAGYSPIKGDNETEFSFAVSYRDIDDDPPLFVNAIIDGHTYNATPVDGNDTTYTDGAVFRAIMKLDPGEHTYHFSASDGVNSVRYPVTGEIAGPLVDGIPYLLNGKVEPEVGEVGELFTFTVVYMDGGNEKPKNIGIKLDGTNHVMSKMDSEDDNFSDGVEYRFRMRIEDAFTHTFKFYAADSDNDALGDTGMQQGPVVTHRPTVGLASPVNNSELSEIPVLEWRGDDEDPDPLTYQVYLSKEFGSVADRELDALIKETNSNSMGLDAIYSHLDNGTYYWTVDISDGILNNTCGSGVWQFAYEEEIIKPDNRKPRVNLTAPGDNTTLQPISFYLKWSGHDPDGDKIIYDLYVSNSLSKIYSPESLVNSTTELRYKYSPPAEGDYYWTVIPRDPYSEGICQSGIYRFSIMSVEEVNIEIRFIDINGKEITSATGSKGENMSLAVMIENKGKVISPVVNVGGDIDVYPRDVDIGELGEGAAEIIHLYLNLSELGEVNVSVTVYLGETIIGDNVISILIRNNDEDGKEFDEDSNPSDGYSSPDNSDKGGVPEISGVYLLLVLILIVAVLGVIAYLIHSNRSGFQQGEAPIEEPLISENEFDTYGGEEASPSVRNVQDTEVEIVGDAEIVSHQDFNQPGTQARTDGDMVDVEAEDVEIIEKNND